MVAPKVSNDAREFPLNVKAFGEMSDRHVRSRRAASEATKLAEQLSAGCSEAAPPDELVLFRALQTCVYRATRRVRGRRAGRERATWRKRWKLIRDAIVEQNLGLVWCMISQFGSSSLDRGEQASAAMMALLKAVDGFNPWLGFRFSTYACNAIRRSLILLTRSRSRDRLRFAVEHNDLFERSASVDTGLELYVDRISRALTRNAGELSDREARVVAWRFPMDGSQGLTLGEIGDAMGLSKERVRQIQKKALGKLRQVLEADPILQ
jgi:RNA polymerase primary sigma factor